jgi:TP901 family phage tail tape measure protein
MAKLESSLILSLIDRVSAPARQVSATVARLNSAASSNRAAIAGMQGQMLGAAGAGYALYRSLAGPITAAVEFESAMADIAKVTDFTAGGLTAYGKELRVLATSEIPMAVTELAALSENAAAAGIAQEDLLGFTKLTAKAALAWGIGGAEAGDDLARIKTALGLTISQTELYADAINHLADNTASSAPSLIAFSKEVAVQGEFFGFTKEQTLAFGSAMISSGADANVAATSFRNMGRALTKGTSASTRQMNAFKKLGMSATKVAAAMQKDAVGTTMEVIEAIGQLPKEMQAAAISDLFGDEARALIPLLGNTEALRQALGFVSDELAYSGSVGKEFETRAKTTGFAIQRFKNQFYDLGITIGSILLPPFNDLLAIVGPIATKIAQFAEAHPDLTRNVVAATAALIGFKLATTGLKLLGLIGKGGVIDLMTLAFRGLIDPAKNAGKAVGNMLALQGSLAAMDGKKYGAFGKLADSAKALALAAPGMGLAEAAIGAIGSALGVISLPMVAGIAAVAGAGFLIYKYWDRISSYVSGFASAMAEELRPALTAIEPILKWFAPLGEEIGTGWETVKNALSGIGELISGLFQQEQLTEDQKASFAQAGAGMARSMVDAIKAAVNAMVAWFKGLGARIKAAVGQIIIDVGSTFTGPVNDAINGAAGIVNKPFMAAPGEVVQTPQGPMTMLPRHARGGRAKSGWAMVGEEGPELVEFGGPGSVHTAAETRGILSSSGAGGSSRVLNLTQNISINGSNLSVSDLVQELGRQARDAISAGQFDQEYFI